MRDGYIRLFTYLPSTMGERFVKYIEKVIPSILTVTITFSKYHFYHFISGLVRRDGIFA